MNFYTLDYIIQNQSFEQVVRTVAIIALLLMVGFMALVYLRNKLATRFRDISIGVVLLATILLFIQVESYFQFNNDYSQSHALVAFVEGVAIDQNVDKEDIMVNSLSLQDGMIVRYNSEDYMVNLKQDNNTYTLERTHVINHNVYVNGKRN